MGKDRPRSTVYPQHWRSCLLALGSRALRRAVAVLISGAQSSARSICRTCVRSCFASCEAYERSVRWLDWP